MHERALLDTNVVAYWIAGHEAFKSSVAKVFGDLRRKKTSVFISAVTVQELEVWARFNNSLEDVRAYLGANYPEPLALDKHSAREAARLAAVVQRPKGGTKSETAELVDRWHRDASIAGIANHHGMNKLVTANRKDFEPFVEHVNFELIVLASVQ